MLLVTGITGHSGRFFVQKMLKTNYSGKIRAIVRETSDISWLNDLPLDIELSVGDLSDQSFVARSMVGVRNVLHIANIRFSPDVVKAAGEKDLKRVVCVHTTGIYSKFRMASKEYQEIEDNLGKICIDHPGLQLVILRPTMIFGDLCDRNMSKLIRLMDKYRIFPLIDGGRGLIQPVNARDLGEAYWKVLCLDDDVVKKTYILSGGTVLSMREALQAINKNLKKETLFISMPSVVGEIITRLCWFLTFGRVDYIEKVKRMSEDRCFSHSDATRDFSYEPESFANGIRREVEEYIRRK